MDDNELSPRDQLISDIAAAMRARILELEAALKTAVVVIENAVSAYPSPSASKALEELRKVL